MYFQLTAISVFICGVSLFGQSSFTRISGEVSVEGGDPQARYTVELVEPSRHQSVERAIVGPNARFDFPVAAGDYELRLLSSQGDILNSQTIREGSPSTDLDLRASVQSASRAEAGVISVNRLRHRTPPKAAREFRKATEAWDHEDLNASIAHLQKAIAIDPEFMEAHHDLGCKYLRAGDPAAAAAELERAVQLDPGSSRAYSNLALVYLRTGRIAEAEGAAKRAFALDGQSPMAHYVLGLARFAGRRYDSETLHHLEVAREQLPFAERPTAALQSIMNRSFTKH